MGGGSSAESDFAGGWGSIWPVRNRFSAHKINARLTDAKRKTLTPIALYAGRVQGCAEYVMNAGGN